MDFTTMMTILSSRNLYTTYTYFYRGDMCNIDKSMGSKWPPTTPTVVPGTPITEDKLLAPLVLGDSVDRAVPYTRLYRL